MRAKPNYSPGFLLKGRLKLPDVITLLDSMAKDGSLEWEKVPGASGAGGYIPSSIMNTVSGVTGGGGGGGGAGGGGGPGSAGGSGIPAGRTTAYVWWRKPEEWANVIYDWVCWNVVVGVVGGERDT